MGLADATALLAAATPRRLCLPSGIEIATLTWGDRGPLLLLHHANGFCKGVWGLVADALRARCTVVAMDARGHGDSSHPRGAGAYAWERFAEDVLAVAEALAAEQPSGRVACGIGHSFGGTSMLGAAARHPDLFERILLVDPVTPPPPGAPIPPERQGSMQRLVQGARKRRNLWPTRAAARTHFAERSLFARWDPRAIDLYVTDGLRERRGGQVALKCAGATEATIFGNSRGVDVFALARGIRTPALWLWAARGDFPRPVYEALAASMADATVETVDAGHLIPMERPDVVVEAVERLL